jgi:hypothetical protein
MQVPFGMMPPWMLGMMMPGSDSQHSQVQDIAVPARVNKAMEFLDHVASKRRKMPAASEHSVEVVEQDNLCAEEEATRDSALQLLTKYFDGNLTQDPWEELRFQTLKKRLEMGTKEGRLIGCVVCHPLRPDPNCILCGGSGKIFVQAAGGPSEIPQSIEQEKEKEGESQSIDD